MPTLHLVDGEKGGTGKSWVSRTMHHVFEARGIPFIGVDADTANPTYKNVYADARQIPFGLDPKTADLADAIFQYAIESDVIVSLPAQVHQALHSWLSTKDVPTLAKAHNITIKKWWVSDGENDSISLFLKSIEVSDASIQHIFVQNLGRCDEWEYFDSHAQIHQTIRDRQIPVIAFPVLGQLRRIRINAEQMAFEKALSFPAFGILGQSQVGLYLKKAEQVLVDGGAFGEPNKQAMTIAHSPMPVLQPTNPVEIPEPTIPESSEDQDKDKNTSKKLATK